MIERKDRKKINFGAAFRNNLRIGTKLSKRQAETFY
jgi:hypothetical protein